MARATALVGLIIACHAPAPVRVLSILPSVRGSLAKQVPETIRRVREVADGRLALPPSAARVECVELTDVSGVIVCVFNTARFMNYALNRASEFVEHERKVLSDRAHLDEETIETAEGHDLRGEDLLAFDRAWTAARSSFAPVDDEDSREKLALERDFWDAFVRPRLKKTPDLVLLAVAIGTDIEATLSHEILHAQYFQTKELRRIVGEYWSASVSDADKERVKAALRESYDVENAELLVNEFQAYVLMHGAEESELSEISKKHREPLAKQLAAAGIDPIQFSLAD